MSTAHITESDDTHDHDSQNRHGGLKIVVGLVVLAVILGLTAKWLYFRHTHVTSEDAQVVTNEITVSSRLAGRVESFDQRRGNLLKAGQVLAQLDPKPTQLLLAHEQHQVDVAKAKLAYEEHAVEVATKQRSGGKTQEQAELASDEASVNVAQAEANKAEHAYRRAERLFKAGQTSAQQRDDAYFDYQSAQAALVKAKKQVEVDKAAIANTDLGVLSNPMMLLPDPDLLKSKVAVTQQELEAAQSRVASTQNDLNDLKVRSPENGIVDQTFTLPGEYLHPGQPILMMHRPDDVWIRAKMKETKIAQLSVNQPVAIHVDAYPDTTFRGHVEVIGHAATNQFALLPNPNPSGNFTKITQRVPVRIEIDDGPKARLAPGMMVEVDVDITSAGS